MADEPVGDLGGGLGTLSVVVWPNHAGAVNHKGEEPMFGFDYKRGQIAWELDEKGKLLGHATIDVPAGEWCWIIYCRNPYNPGFVSAQKLAHPLVLTEPGIIQLNGITEDDIKPIQPDPKLHD
jgi:hypothetical protein